MQSNLTYLSLGILFFLIAGIVAGAIITSTMFYLATGKIK